MESLLTNCKRNDRGAVLVLSSILLVALIGLFSIAYMRGAITRTQAELQKAADAAAHSATDTLCGSEYCFDTAREDAMFVLSNHEVFNNIGAERKVFDNGYDPDPNGIWDMRNRDGNNLRITIQRGRWIDPDGDGTFEFQSFEGSWGDNNPHLSKGILANAVHVKVERFGINSVFGSFFGNPSSGAIEAEATAQKGRGDQQCVAPFAIPLCALTDNVSGSLRADLLCKHDLMFTASDRYCDGNPDCHLRPSFFYGPCSDDVDECDLNQNEITQNFAGRNNFPHWRNPALSSIADQFGVVGIPEDGTGVVDQGKIVNILRDQGCMPSSIGQRFLIHHPGLQGSLPGVTTTEDAVWDRITNLGVATSANGAHPPARESILGHIDARPDGRPFPLIAIDPDLQTWASRGNWPGFSSNEVMGWPLPHSYWAEDDGRRLRARLSHTSSGVCRSRRARLGCFEDGVNFEEIQPGAAGPSCRIAPNSNPPYWSRNWTGYPDFRELTVRTQPGVTDDTPVWVTKVPVIAESSGGTPVACSTDVNIADAKLDPNLSYEIVGFIEVTFFDVDVGAITTDWRQLQGPFTQTGSSFPNFTIDRSECPLRWSTRTLTCLPTGLPDTPQPAGYQYYIPRITPPQPGQSAGQANPLNSPTGPNPWVFQENGVPQACNMVRARISCDTEVIASAINGGSLDGSTVPTRLVN